ncbi:DUF1330 domain-containing protein [Halomonas sp. HK25]|uniref:DUF1330 domain-containing protein n=1 Tax=Halomonas sp. HK25 TaxID=3394321 RepID=UPI0039FC175D
MSAYMVVLARDVVADGWEAYQSKVADCIASFGGRYLARRVPAEVLEGEFPYQRITCFIFPDMSSIRDFWRSNEYQRTIKPLREGLGYLDIWAVPGIEVTDQEVQV